MEKRLEECDGENRKYLSVTEVIYLSFKEYVLPDISKWFKSHFKSVRNFFIADIESAMARPIDDPVVQRELRIYSENHGLEPEYFYRELPEKVSEILEEGPKEVEPFKERVSKAVAPVK